MYRGRWCGRRCPGHQALTLYAIRNLLDKNPTQISAAVMAIVNLPILATWWTPPAAAVSGLNVALVLVLGLFVVTRTVNGAKLAELADSTLPPEP